MDVVGRAGGRGAGQEACGESFDRAQRHVERAGLANIEFRQADVQTLDGVEIGFDAVTGCWILAYPAGPVGALRKAAARVRLGRVICKHEPDLGLPDVPNPALISVNVSPLPR